MYFIFYRAWHKLSQDDRKHYIMYVNSRVCCNCGEVGLPSFKSSPIHDCSQRGYKTNKAVAFLNECEICKELFCLVFHLLYHSATVHLCIPAVYCPLFSCGRSFYNKGLFDLHSVRFHNGTSLMLQEVLREHGPNPFAEVLHHVILLIAILNIFLLKYSCFCTLDE